MMTSCKILLAVVAFHFFSDNESAVLYADSTQSLTPAQSDAISYLDARAKGWYVKSDWSFVDGGQCAISCHTTVPYMLGNNFATQQSQEVAKEMRQIITARVNTWQQTTPLYAWDAVNSRSTETVLNSVILLSYDAKISKTFSAETCSALNIMWKSLKDDGTFNWLDASLRPWEDKNASYWASALIALVLERMDRTISSQEQLAACPDIATYAAARTRLYDALKQGRAVADLHGQTWLLWVDMLQNAALLSDSERLGIVTSITAKQLPDGGFKLKDFLVAGAGHPSYAFTADPYMTAIAVEVLRLAKDRVAYDPQVLVSAEHWLEKISVGGWQNKTFRSVNKPTTTWNNGLFKDASIAYWLMASQR